MPKFGRMKILQVVTFVDFYIYNIKMIVQYIYAENIYIYAIYICREYIYIYAIYKCSEEEIDLKIQKTMLETLQSYLQDEW